MSELSLDDFASIRKDWERAQQRNEIMPLSYNEADLKYYKQEFWGYTKHCYPDFEISHPLTADIMRDLWLYFMQSKESRLDLNKGLVILGDIGVGKTTLFTLFSNYLKHYGKSFRMVSARTICTEVREGADLDLYLENKNGISGRPVELCIDDMGREDIPTIIFGQRRNIIEEVIFERHSIWVKQPRVRTHISTNLNWKDIEEIYGEAIADRIKEMSNFIVLKGESRR